MLIEKDKSSLVIIDVQEKLVSVIPKPHTFIDNIIKLQKAAKVLDIITVATEQYPEGLGETIGKIMETFNEQKKHQYPIGHGSIKGYRGNTLFPKTEFSSNKYVFSQIREHPIICGIEAHVCVLQTAIELADKKKKVYVVQDAIASRNEKDYLTALSRMDKYPNIQIVTCEMVLFEWLRSSDHPEFKTISQLIK